MRPRNVDKQVQSYLRRVAEPAQQARSKVAPHYEAIELILRAGYSWMTAYRFLSEELAVPVAEATMRQYVLRRRRAIERTGTASSPLHGKAPTGSASNSPWSALSFATVKATHPPLRVGDTIIPERGTSDWSVLDAIRRDAEKDFRELGEAAKRRRRERRNRV